MKPVAVLNKLQSTIDQLTLRERLMLFACALAVTFGLWEALLAGPLQARSDSLSAEIASRQARIAELDESMRLTADGIGGDMQQQFERLRSLELQLGLAEETLESLTVSLIDPLQMRYVFEGLIEEQHGLRLIRAESLAVESLISNDDEADEPASELYRHGLRLELEGGFMELLAYLRAAEALPWEIRWGNFSLESTDYPVNSIAIEIYTLSLDREWIGV